MAWHNWKLNPPTLEHARLVAADMLPCPFCGGKVIAKQVPDDIAPYLVHEHIPDRPCIIGSLCIHEGLVDLWNRRASEGERAAEATPHE